MKIKGKKIEGANIEVIVLPRGDGNDIVFKAKSVLDFSPFEQLCPTPKPPTKMLKGGLSSLDFDDAGYKATVQQQGRLQAAWTVLESLKATEGLEWETVDYADPNSWNNYEEELKNAGISQAEIMRIIRGVSTACGLNEQKIEEARKRFFMMDQQEKLEQSSLKDGQKSTESGEPVNA